MTALFARSLQASRVAVFQRLLPAVGIRLVSLASRVAADLAARAVAAWRVIHGYHLPTAFPAFPLPSACAASSARNRYKTHSSDKIHLRNDLLAL